MTFSKDKFIFVSQSKALFQRAVELAQIAIVFPELNACSNVSSHNLLFFYPKLSDLVLLVMHNACDTPIQRYLRFVQRRRICDERKETPFVYAQMKPQAKWANWP